VSFHTAKEHEGVRLADLRVTAQVAAELARGDRGGNAQHTHAAQRAISKVKDMLNRLNNSGTQLRGLSPYMASRRRDLLATIGSSALDPSIPAWFLTLSANDREWPEITRMILPGLSDAEIAALTPEERAAAAAENPVACVTHLSDRWAALQKHVLNGTSRPLGTVTDSWARYEAQQRG
jgi:hypothetical protein